MTFAFSAELFALSLVFVAVSMVALWLLSLALRDASIVDIFWGAGFAGIGVLSAVNGVGDPTRRALVGVLACVWGLRLAGYLFWRNVGHGEDRRYAAIRRHHGDAFAWRSLFTVFGLQGALMLVISLPLQVACTSARPPAFAALDLLGLALFAIGLAFESIGDWQLARFKADPANEAKVMDRGLWGWTRHPNYFGDAVVWWGLYLLAAAAVGGAWTVVSPIVMTFFLRNVSGVTLLERGLRRRRPDYAAYAERVPAFVPRPPRRASAPRRATTEPGNG